MEAMKAEDEFAVQGAVRVLKELSRDLTDSQVPSIDQWTFFLGPEWRKNSISGQNEVRRFLRKNANVFDRVYQ